MSNIVNGYIIGCDFMRFDEFKIDGVEIKINDEYALINGKFKHIYYFKGKEEFETVLKLKECIECL